LGLKTGTVDVRAVQRAEILQDEATIHQIDVAMVLGDNPIEDLNRVVGMATQRVVALQLDNSLVSFWGRDG
jgi:hypothetical protein